MMTMKKMVATNKMCVYGMMTVLGAVVGMTAAKSLINHCCTAERLKCKAKRAFKTMENKMMP